MRHIFLVGFMGAGKSTVGRILADRLGMPLVDLDEEIERTSGQPVSQLFAERGEDAFRDIERDVLDRVSAGPDTVVACGGGVVLRDENRRLLAARGTVVLLEVGAEEAFSRVRSAPGRPLLAGKCASAAAKLLDARRALYDEVADVRVTTDGRTPEEIAAEVMDSLVGSSARPSQVTVSAGDRTYDVLVGDGLLAECGPRLRALSSARKAAVVTDANVAPLFLGRVESSMQQAGFEVVPIVIEAGEASKDWATAGAVLGELARARLDRNDLVVALGGGVVGDLAGFCAASYMRGIAFAQLPTTLLAQVDSSIGGKTGVDLAEGKNLAGAFWQPVAVLADTATLSTVPEDEWRSGLAEVVKAALLDGEPAVTYLEREAGRLVSRDASVVRDAVRMAVTLKARVVGADEREAGVRECLNYGHTLGHAIENVAGYGAIPHGLAVAEGIRFAAGLAERLLEAPKELTARQERLLDAVGLTALETDLDEQRLVEAMRSDKKSRGGAVRFVLLREPGRFEVVEVDETTLTESVAAWAGKDR